MEIIGSVWAIVLIISAIIGGAAYLKSALVRQRNDELQQLAETRGETIKDLRAEVEDLRRDVAHLTGMVTALNGIKANEIADLVVAKLINDPIPES